MCRRHAFLPEALASKIFCVGSLALGRFRSGPCPLFFLDFFVEFRLGSYCIFTPFKRVVGPRKRAKKHGSSADLLGSFVGGGRGEPGFFNMQIGPSSCRITTCATRHQPTRRASRVDPEFGSRSRIHESAAGGCVSGTADGLGLANLANQRASSARLCVRASSDVASSESVGT
jgi:hypothetical protein